MRKEIQIEQFKNMMFISAILFMACLVQILLAILAPEGRSTNLIYFGYVFWSILGVIAVKNFVDDMCEYLSENTIYMMDSVEPFMTITPINWLSCGMTLAVAFMDFTIGYSVNSWYYISSILFLMLFYGEAVKIKLIKEYQNAKDQHR